MRSSIFFFAFLQMLTCCSLATQQCPTLVEISSSSQPNLDIYDCNIGSSQEAGLLVIDSRENPPFLPSNSPPSLSNSSHPPTPGTISVSLYRGLVWPSSLISILLPNSTVYSTVPALQITIADSAFKGGGGVQISGSLPPNSVLRITNNTFELDAIAKPAWFVDVLAGIAYIAVPDDYLSYLGNMSLVEVSRNSFVGTGRLSAGFSTVGFSWRGSGVYREGAAVTLSENYFSLRCEGTLDPIFDQRACVVGMHLVANQYFNENGSSLTVDGNTFDISGGFIAALPPIEVSGALGSTASFSNNRARADTRGAVGSYVLSVGSFVTGDNMMPIQNDFRFGMINNTLNITGNSACAVGFGPAIPTDLIFGPPETGLIAMVSNSRMLFDSNMLISEGCDVQVIMERSITLSDQAQISISNNNFNRADETQIETAAIVLTNTFSVPTSTTLPPFTVFGNRWSANNTIPAPEEGNTKQLFGTLNFQEVVVSAPNGSIQACSNVFYGINVQGSGETVKLLSTPAIAEVIRTDACVDAIETTEYASTVSEYEPTSIAMSSTSSSTAMSSTCTSDTTPKRDMDTKVPTVIPSCAMARNFSIAIAFLLASFVFFM